MDGQVNVTLITDSDLDGVGCAVLVERALKGSIYDVVYSNPRAVDEAVQDFLVKLSQEKDEMRPHHLIISDLCPSREGVKCLIEMAQEDDFDVTIADHHEKTAWLKEYESPNVLHDEGRCGTLLVHDWINAQGLVLTAEDRVLGPADAEWFAKTVDVYDRWVLESDLRPRSEKLNRLRWFLGIERFVEEFAKDWYADKTQAHTYIDACLREQEERAVTDIVARHLVDENIYMDREKRRFLFLPVSKYASQVGNAILEDDESIDYVVMLNVAYGSLSFRARRGGVNTSQIAERFGGGGHPAAAGCAMPVMEAVKAFIAGLL